MNSFLPTGRFFNLPAFFAVIAILGGSFLVLLHLRARHHALDAEWAAWKYQTPTVAAGTPKTSSVAPAAGETTLSELQDAVERERAARVAAEKRAAVAARQLEAFDGQLLISFGRIEKMGRDAARVLSGTAGSATGEVDPQADLIAQVPEILRFEDDPREIARFEGALLQEMGGLDATATQRLISVLVNEFSILKARGLNASQRPQTDSVRWDGARAAFLQDLAVRLRPVLPSTTVWDVPLAALLNFGLGVRMEENTEGGTSVRPIPPGKAGLPYQ